MTTKIKTTTSDEVMFKSNGKCVVCQNPGHHIHHIDGNNNNHAFENLALLCFSHHHDATITGGLARKLSAGEIKKYRALHYKKVAHERKLKSNPKYRTLKNIDFLYELCLDAIVAIEVGKLKNNLSSSDWGSTDTSLFSFFAFPDNIGIRGRQTILEALEEISSRTRDGMPLDVAYSISNLVTYIIPTKRIGDTINTKELTLYELGIATGFNIVYDGIKYLNNCKHAYRGLDLIFRVTRYSGFNKKVMEVSLRDIDRLLEMSSSYTIMNKLISIYKTSIKTKDVQHPDLPNDLEEMIFN
jgi:hypothetical protein